MYALSYDRSPDDILLQFYYTGFIFYPHDTKVLYTEVFREMGGEEKRQQIVGAGKSKEALKCRKVLFRANNPPYFFAVSNFGILPPITGPMYS